MIGFDASPKRARCAHFIGLYYVANFVANCLSPMPVAKYIRGMSNAQRARHGSYIFQRPGSLNWYVKLRGPEGRTERSLGTADRREAEILAGPLVTAHKAALLAARPRFEISRWYEYEPGRQHAGPDGLPIIATAESLIYLDASGAIRETTPNGALQYRHPTRLNKPSFEVFDRERAAAPQKKNGGDDAIIETYIAHANLKEGYAREARHAWALYKTLTDSKPLKDATRDDGRKLVAHLDAQGLKTATMQKKIGWLTAACNLAIDEGRLKFNPFSSVIPKRDDKARRLPLDDADMAALKANLDVLDERNQLLFRILACTGMRLSEALSIKEEKTENGVRYVVVGTKTAQSLRRVPLPADVLPFLPKTIKGPLFTGTALAASKRFSLFLDRSGITDPNKTTHSLRHRAQDRLRAAGCPQDIREALLGHSKLTVGEGYGSGFPVTMLREWIDKIGL